MNRAKLARSVYVLRREGFVRLLSKGIFELGDSLLSLAPREANIIFNAFENVQTSGIMIDVGAGTGTSFEDFAVGGWFIHAFEPDIHNRAKLEGIFANWPQLKIDPRAVSDLEARSVPFYVSEESVGVSSLIPFLTTHKQSATVNTITLRSYISETGLKKIDFLKVDAEGSDLRVLQGFPWNSYSPTVVMCEFDDAKTSSLGYTWIDLAQLLASHSYKIIVSEWEPFERYGERKRWWGYKMFPCELSAKDSWGNLIATHSNELLMILSRLLREFSAQRARRMSILGPIMGLLRVERP